MPHPNPPIPSDILETLSRASIFPKGCDPEGNFVWERGPAMMGEAILYRFTTPPQCMKDGYEWLTIFDQLYRSGVAAGEGKVRAEVRKALGL